MTRSSPNKQLLLTAPLLGAVLALFQFTDLDVRVQDLFYDFGTGTWLLDREDPVLEFIFYSGIKKALIAFAVGVLVALVAFRKTRTVRAYRHGLIIVLLSAILVPAVAGGLKAVTNTPCPKNIAHYGGDYPDVKVFDAYPAGFERRCSIRCWPAGHASGGFALLSLFFLFKKPKNRRYAVAFALTLGWSMGLYKMLIGDHFLSHTLITMLLAWMIILLIRAGVGKFTGNAPVKQEENGLRL